MKCEGEKESNLQIRKGLEERSKECQYSSMDFSFSWSRKFFHGMLVRSFSDKQMSMVIIDLWLVYHQLCNQRMYTCLSCSKMLIKISLTCSFLFFFICRSSVQMCLYINDDYRFEEIQVKEETIDIIITVYITSLSFVTETEEREKKKRPVKCAMNRDDVDAKRK